MSDLLTTLLIFGLILGLLIFVHEFGHFITAKLFGVRVEEFGFGLPPRLFGLKRGETIYSINAIPAGGFVNLSGEDAEENSKDPRHFLSKSPLKRALIITAGILMNFLLAFVAFTILYSQGGPIDTGKVLIDAVVKDSPAEKVGLKSGDIVFEMAGKKLNGINELTAKVKSEEGKEVELKVQRDNKVLDFKVTPRVSPPPNQGALGIALAPVVEIKKFPIWQAPIVGTTEAINITGQMVVGLKDMALNLLIKKEAPKDVGGIVRIGYITHKVIKAGILPLIQWTGLLSLNLAIINILPIPALDGGRLFFTLIEAVNKKRVPLKAEKWIHMMGFAVILVLFVLITYNDIIYLLQNTALRLRLKEIFPFL